LLNQVKELSTWQGLVMHGGIARFAVPELGRVGRADWESVAARTADLARKQFAFSAERRHLEPGMSKSASDGEYCILAEHERGEEIPASQLDTLCQVVVDSVAGLGERQNVLVLVEGRGKYWAELSLSVPFDGARVSAWVDLLCFVGYGKPIIIDWKAEKEGAGGDHRLQLGLYGWAMCRSETWQVSDPTSIRLAEVQLLRDELVEHRCDRGLLEEAEDFAYQSIAEISALCGDHKYASLNLSDFEFAQNPNSCQYCSMRPLCKEC
jgi:hypothetical protein